ncbi:uncharacterized protein [Eurosta solidaginis]|uniref:uncharacterized protein isoform X3 n=1 Tax=Eurosta solidaginis TaxID=178769 RepID=UPI00353105D6
MSIKLKRTWMLWRGQIKSFPKLSCLRLQRNSAIMKGVIKIKRLLLLLKWLLFMANICIVDIVTADGASINTEERQQQLQDALYAQQQANWYNQQLQQQQQLKIQQYQQKYNPPLSTFPLSAPTTAIAQQLLGATKAADQEFTTTTLPNQGVDYKNETLNQAETSDDADDQKRPSEIQKAVCTVTAGDVRASAEAVTTKKLKGVCGSAELKLAFSDLEAKLYKELQEIKTLVKLIAQQQGINVPQPITFATASAPLQPMPNNFYSTTPQHNAPVSQQRKSYTRTTPTSAAKPLFQPIVEPESNAVDTSAEVSYEYEEPSMISAENDEDILPKKAPQLKSLKALHAKSKAHPSSSELQEEIRKFNNTLLSDSELKAFTYYWKLENFTERIENGSSSIVESPTFSIKGKPLHLRAYFQHLNRDFLYLQLSQASIKSSNRHNVIIDMGGLFKEIANDKISFKHKITVLNQHSQRSKDLVSQELNNLETGFIIPNSALLKSPYIKNDSLLIQIFLYL